MTKQLVFTVVDHSPDKPYQAYWSSNGWEIMGGDNLVWFIDGEEQDATQSAHVEAVESNQDQLIQALSVALHSEAATAYIKGGGND